MDDLLESEVALRDASYSEESHNRIGACCQPHHATQMCGSSALLHQHLFSSRSFRSIKAVAKPLDLQNL